MAIGLGLLIIIVGLAISLWLAYSAQTQVKQLRHELDQTQRMLNETQQRINETQKQVNDLKATAEAAAAPPPLPRARARSGSLDDLREQLRAAHSEEEPSADD